MEYDMTEDLEEFSDEWEDWAEEENTEIIRAKWIMDGASTLQEARIRVTAFAEYLGLLEKEGWYLIDPVHDDYGFIMKREEGENV